MMDYFDEIHVRLEKYKKVHKKHPRAAIIKMLLWNGAFLLKVPKPDNKNNKKNGNAGNGYTEIIVDKTKLNIGFLVNGGIGDFIIGANYIYKFRQKYDCTMLNLDVYVSRNEEAASVLFGENIAEHMYCVEHSLIYSENLNRKYDLFIDLDRYPLITNRNIEKMKCFQPLLLDYMLAIEKFKMLNPRLLERRPFFDGQSAMVAAMSGIKRIQQADVGQVLGISEEYSYPIDIKIDEENTLEKFGLAGKKFIVIVSGADSKCGGNQSNKIWPAVYYDELLERIKKENTDYLLVQIGVNEEDYCYDGIDCNLSGKTSFEESMILLKRASLLIGNEGGMVHLRHALHGGTSIVLFGSTDSDFFGYSENKNIVGNGCASSCEWLYRDWQIKCSNKNQYACMWSITPRMVMDEIRKALEEIEQ